jgi:probable selenium-dependent hydroxylase accessory protein YqeC
VTHDLVSLLGADSGIVCAIGAGGKKTTLYTLAAHYTGRLALTSSVFVTHFPDELGARTIVSDEPTLETMVPMTGSEQCVAYACPSEKKGRYGGVSPQTIADLHQRSAFDLTLVKADGARMRWVKAPGDGEPVLVPECTTVIAVLSARAIGQALSERVAHRVERVASAADLGVGETITPLHFSRLFTSADGLQAGTGDSRFVPVINMVDDAEVESLAIEAAEHALASTDRFTRVILATMRDKDHPVVRVVEN